MSGGALAGSAALEPGTPPDGRLIGLVSAAHGGSHFFHLVLPALFPWLIDAFETSSARLGLLVALFFAISGVGQALVGVLVDRLGAARVLAVGLALLGLGAVVAALAPNVATLFLAVVLMGLGNSVFHPADYAILSHHVRPSRLGRAYGAHTIGGSIGWALSPLFMAATAEAVGWRAALLLAALIGLALAGLVGLARARLETPRETQAPARSGGIRGYAGLVLTSPILFCFAFFVFLSLSLIGLQTFMPLTLERTWGWSEVLANGTVTALMLSSAAGTLWGGIFADRGGGSVRGLIALGLAGSALCIGLAGAFGSTPWLLYPLAAAAGLLQGFATPSRDLLVRAAAPPKALGRVFGFVYAGLDLGSTLAPLVMGLLLVRGGGWVFAAAALFLLLSLVCAVSVRPGGANA